MNSFFHGKLHFSVSPEIPPKYQKPQLPELQAPGHPSKNKTPGFLFTKSQDAWTFLKLIFALIRYICA
jgi:hypothetical protein